YPTRRQAASARRHLTTRHNQQSISRKPAHKENDHGYKLVLSIKPLGTIGSQYNFNQAFRRRGVALSRTAATFGRHPPHPQPRLPRPRRCPWLERHSIA